MGIFYIYFIISPMGPVLDLSEIKIFLIFLLRKNLLVPYNIWEKILNFSSFSGGEDWVKKSMMKTATGSAGLKKQTKIVMSKALEEDPTVFQYDEVSFVDLSPHLLLNRTKKISFFPILYNWIRENTLLVVFEGLV